MEYLQQLYNFFDLKDENNITNWEKITRYQKIIRRNAKTDKNKSFEESASDIADGIILKDGKLIGFGIHIYNEDIYPIQSFEIYLRGCRLSGCLDLNGYKDLLFVDVYNNNINEIKTEGLSSLRIFGVQNNSLKRICAGDMPECIGMDAGFNMLKEIDVTNNRELVELYINNNEICKIDISQNIKMKYFYCHNNQIRKLDTRNNPLLRHLNATNNPMKEIRSLAPQQNGKQPLELFADEGGYVGLKFNPIYNAQWKETGEWEQSYYAYPDNGFDFVGWFDESNCRLYDENIWIDIYGNSRILTAKFARTVRALTNDI